MSDAQGAATLAPAPPSAGTPAEGGAAPAWRTRLRARWHRPLVNSRVASEVLGWGHLARAVLPVGGLVPRRLALLSAAKRARSGVLQRLVQARVRPLLEDPARGGWREHRIGWQRFYGSFGKIGEQNGLTSSVILKEPGPDGELGVIYCAFEYNPVRLMAFADAARFGREYLLVSESSYSPTDFAPYASWAGLSPHPVFLSVSNQADARQYRMLDRVIRPLPFMACDLTDPTMFAPRPRAERDIDILMVANWLLLKRHWLLYEALRRLPRDLRIVFVGRNAPGRTERTMREEMRAFGVRQEIELLTNIPIEEVYALQARAKVAPLLTDREGSCVSVAECLFADTPVVMMRDAHVGARAHVNASTGRIAARGNLWRHLAELIDGAPVAPRDWAVRHIAADITSARLNAILRDHCRSRDLPWTQDIAPVCRRYVPTYLHAADAERLRGAPRRFQERYGIEVVQFQHRPSTRA